MKDELIAIRPAEAQDVPQVVRLRRLMFESMGVADPVQLDAADLACELYFARAIPSGAYRGWLAVTPNGQAVASGGAVIDQHPPGPNNLSGRVGYIMNLSTEPAYRRQGLARRILEWIVESLRAEGITLAALHATEVGRPLYAAYGFQDSNEMRARL